ncbi:MAG: carboxypeptidase-like regulatory domain-containing protein [Spirochaetes bacterium]|nr:carboxypeptidase-like regulatory domain-containing protein [Spirochaetota bacterium]
MKWIRICLFAALAAVASSAWSREGNGIVLSGRIIDSVTKRPVEFGTVAVLEERKKVYTDMSGSYRISVKEPGEYTVIVTSDKLRSMRTRVSLQKNTVRDFYLQPLTIRGQGITITGSRDIQKVSRYTMTVKELKEVPGSLGDSVNALASMPGVIRTDGVFGPLVIRGMSTMWNRYLIDEIPIYNPIHFGGMHSVINNNLMSEIDLYSSAFPARFGSCNGALIAINTVDDVKEFGGYADMGLISAASLIQAPILRNKNTGGISFASPSYMYRQDDEYENAGYMIASGRYGYLSLMIPLIYKLVTGDSITYIPEYWDYQFKARYNFNRAHSLTVLLMGSSDYFRLFDSSRDMVDPTDGDDPLLMGLKIKINYTSHSQGLYYTWQPGSRFWNRVIAYGALMKYYTFFDVPSATAASWLKNVHVDSRPYIFGVKDMFRAEPWEDHLVLTGGVEYTYYYYTATGKSIFNATSGTGFNPADENAFANVYLDNHIVNQTVGGYLQAKLTFGWLTLEPGVRADYLHRTRETIVDPRGVASIELPTDTTLSVAGGQYSYFFQTNPYLFNSMPQIAKIGRDLKPERAIHRVVGVEQRFLGDYSIKVEGFYNTFRDLAMGYYHYEPDGRPLEGFSSGRAKMYGAEVMLKKELREDENGLYGWINYTYSRSRVRSNLPAFAGLYGDSRNQVGDPYGNQWTNFNYEQLHNLKLVAGMTFRPQGARGRHTWSIRFQYYTGRPYTRIVGSTEDLVYAAANPGLHRYVPLYGRTNASRFEDNQQLDFRYTYRVDYSWGYVSWYVDFINLTGYYYQPRNVYSWDYRFPYGPNNPRLRRPKSDEVTWIPNFGVEIKF